ncbi:MAG: hypothetical protein ACR2NI_04580 [Pirellulales bacterium]
MKTLFKQAEGFAAVYNAGTWDFESSGSGWEVTSNTANNFTAVFRGYFDLAGMSMDEKTLFFRDVQIQLQTPPTTIQGVTGDNVTIQTYVTDQPMDDFDFLGPGFSFSRMNAENCLIHRTQTWCVTFDTFSYGDLMQLVAQTSNGMMKATASDRLYYSIYVKLNALKIGAGPTSPLERLFVPGHRIVIDVDAKEEPDHEYIMRLLRSYQLQQEPDVD